MYTNLTWVYLIVQTSNQNLLLDREWIINGAGLRVSHGFGVIDAEALETRQGDESVLSYVQNSHIHHSLLKLKLLILTMLLLSHYWLAS